MMQGKYDPHFRHSSGGMVVRYDNRIMYLVHGSITVASLSRSLLCTEYFGVITSPDSRLGQPTCTKPSHTLDRNNAIRFCVLVAVGSNMAMMTDGDREPLPAWLSKYVLHDRASCRADSLLQART